MGNAESNRILIFRGVSLESQTDWRFEVLANVITIA
jgi:hypothetical protein